MVIVTEGVLFGPREIVLGGQTQVPNHGGVKALLNEVASAVDLRSRGRQPAQRENLAGQLLRRALQRVLVETNSKRQPALGGAHRDGSIC